MKKRRTRERETRKKGKEKRIRNLKKIRREGSWKRDLTRRRRNRLSCKRMLRNRRETL